MINLKEGRNTLKKDSTILEDWKVLGFVVNYSRSILPVIEGGAGTSSRAAAQ